MVANLKYIGRASNDLQLKYIRLIQTFAICSRRDENVAREHVNYIVHVPISNGLCTKMKNYWAMTHTKKRENKKRETTTTTCFQLASENPPSSRQPQFIHVNDRDHNFNWD